MSSQKFIPKKNTGLGKGLSALIPGASLKSDGTLKDHENVAVNEIPVSQIRPNPFQPRKEFDPQALEELKNSILQNGIIQPITVRKAPGGYELIAGERRFRAAKMANLHTMPAYVRDDVRDEEMLELAIIENVQREKLNPIELAQGYQQLIDVCELTQDEVAKRVSKDRTTVTNIIRLLKLPGEIQESLRKEEITIGHGRAIVALPNVTGQIKVWREAVAKMYSVRKTEQVVKALLDGDNKSKKSGKVELETESSSYIADIENRLRLKFGTKVKLKHHEDGKGMMEIDYYSLDDLERLLELFEA
jgi:ParB family chromosome partitioning protein